MKPYLYTLAILAVLCTASAVEVEMHVLTTTNNGTQTIYIWTEDGTPINCGTGSSVTCDLNVNTPLNSTCNQTVLDEISGNMTQIATKVTNIDKTVSSTIVSSVSPLLTTTQANNLFDKLKGEISSQLAVLVEERIAPFATNNQEVNELKLNLTRVEGQLINSNNQVTICSQDLQDSKGELESRTWVCIVLLAVTGFLLYTLITGGKLPFLDKTKPR